MSTKYQHSIWISDKITLKRFLRLREEALEIEGTAACKIQLNLACSLLMFSPGGK